MTRDEAIAEILTSGGKIVSLEFVKRTDGTLRQMVCRTGVKAHLKDGEPAYNREEKGLICIFDMAKQQYRSIPIEGITRNKP